MKGVKYSETNLYEHKLSYVYFLAFFIGLAVAGLGIGFFIQKLIQKLFSNDTTSKAHSFYRMTVNLTVIASLFYFGIHLISRTFDDWFWGTFSGAAFAFTFFATQEEFYKYVKIIVA